MSSIQIKRDSDGKPTEECKENVGIKIGSFDCTANCPYNQNTKQEIQTEAFDLKTVKCSKIKLNQLLFEI